VIEVVDGFTSSIPTLVECSVVRIEFVEDVGLEEPSTETAVLSWWVGEKDEHALICSYHGKKAPQVL
jgi:hypothetical protein